MKKNAIAIIAFAAVSSLSGFTDVSKPAEQKTETAVTASFPKSNLLDFQELSDATSTGRSNKFLSTWD
jgi:hypothetical protein